MPLFLLRAGELEQHRGAGRHGGHRQLVGPFVAGQLDVERPLVLGRQSLTAVLRREADPGEPAVEQLPLQGARLFDGGQFLGFGDPFEGERVELVRTDRLEVVGDPGPGPRPERLDVLHWFRCCFCVVGHAVARSRSAMSASLSW